MKREEDLKAWMVAAFMLEVYVVLCQPAYSCVVYKPGYPAYDVNHMLMLDISLGLCLLPVMAGLRRGTRTEKVAAVILGLFPLFYICVKVFSELPICLTLLFDS